MDAIVDVEFERIPRAGLVGEEVVEVEATELTEVLVRDKVMKAGFNARQAQMNADLMRMFSEQLCASIGRRPCRSNG